MVEDSTEACMQGQRRTSVAESAYSGGCSERQWDRRNCAVGAPDGSKARRAIKLVLEGEVWGLEVLLLVKELPWD